MHTQMSAELQFRLLFASTNITVRPKPDDRHDTVSHRSLQTRPSLRFDGIGFADLQDSIVVTSARCRLICNRIYVAPSPVPHPHRPWDSNLKSHSLTYLSLSHTVGCSNVQIQYSEFMTLKNLDLVRDCTEIVCTLIGIWGRVTVS